MMAEIAMMTVETAGARPSEVCQDSRAQRFTMVPGTMSSAVAASASTQKEIQLNGQAP